jgi:hypothetical protein
VPTPKRPLTALILAVCLFLPAGAAAQSAGDDQYADPFEETSSQPAPSDDSPSRVLASPGTDPSSTGTSSSASTTAGSGSAGQLAYTGFNLPLLFVTGAVMLLAGFTVRRVTVGPYASPR